MLSDGILCFYLPHLGHIRSAVSLQFRHEDPHDVENEDQIDLEIFPSLSKTGLERSETHGVGRQHGGRDEIEKVGRLGPAAPAAVLRHPRARALRGRAWGRGHFHRGRPERHKHQRHGWNVGKYQILWLKILFCTSQTNG